MESLKKEIIDNIIIYNKYLDRSTLEPLSIDILISYLHPANRISYRDKYKTLLKE